VCDESNARSWKRSHNDSGNDDYSLGERPWTRARLEVLPPSTLDSDVDLCFQNVEQLDCSILSARQGGAQQQDAEQGAGAQSAAGAQGASPELPRVSSAVDMFRGRMLVRKDAREEDGSAAESSIEEDFDTIILDVSGHPDVYESLDAFMSRTEVEYTTPRGLKTKAMSQGWITKLPDVLILQQRRVLYNSEVQSASKVQSRFEFPDAIYMDRYLLENRERLAVEIGTYSETMAEVHKVRRMCAEFDHFSSPLPAAFNGCLQYFEDDGMRGLREAALAFAQPESVAPEQMAGALRQHMGALDALGANLHQRLAGLKAQARYILDSPALKRHAYQLHAVLIHDGMTPQAGHYYAFVRHPESGQWFRMNDLFVEEVTPEIVMTEAFGAETPGSTRNAYSMMYVSDSIYERTLEREREREQGLSDEIPIGLVSEVQQSNSALEADVAEYDTRQHLVFEGLEQLACTGAAVHAAEESQAASQSSSLGYNVRSISPPGPQSCARSPTNIHDAPKPRSLAPVIHPVTLILKPHDR
jgi:hypothetical protein